jgi:hypothetical protein
MKVTLNLAVARSPRERYALAWAVPVILLSFAGLLFLSGSALRSVRDCRRLHAERLGLDRQGTALDETEQALRKELDQPRLRTIFRETQFVNDLIDRKKVSVATLAERVTKLLPVSAHLASMSLLQNDRDRAVRFVVVASSEEALENFLNGLEDSSDFKDVVNVNEGIEETGAAAGQVMVTCTARYVGRSYAGEEER